MKIDLGGLGFVASKAIFSIVVLFTLAKLLGKKQVSQLNIFDYVIGISIGNIAAEMSINADVNFIEGAIAMAIYAFSSILISSLALKSIRVRRFIAGAPVILIQDGVIIPSNLKEVKFDLNDLTQEARSNGYFDLSQIEFAVMEASGRISFLPKSKYAPLTPNDMKIKTTYTGLTANLVIDGNIMYNNLKAIGKDEEWLLTRIKHLKKDLSSILLLTCNSDEKITIYDKNPEIELKDCLE